MLFAILKAKKLVPTPIALSKLSDVVKNVVVKNYTTINTTLNAKINEVKKQVPSIANLATTTTALNAKIDEVKNKIPNITNLATTTDLTAVEIKIPNVGNLVKKTD